MSASTPAPEPASPTQAAGSKGHAPQGHDQPDGGHSGTTAVPPPLQAAQLEHTLEFPPESKVVHGSTEPSNCALAGGASAPQSPLADAAPPSVKKRRRKLHDNHVSVRFSDDEDDIVIRRMERTGEKQSDAVRAIIRESEHIMGHVYLAPKAPPEALETLLGMLIKWRKDFATAKPRLNIPTPASDDSRYAEVQKWRKEADRLLVEIPRLEIAITAAMRALTSLTPESAEWLKGSLPRLRIWLKDREENRETRGPVPLYRAIVALIEDMGLGEKEGGK